MLNATISSPYNTLYGATDFSSLNWFEQRWAAWYIWINNPIIATGLASFLMHEVSAGPALCPALLTIRRLCILAAAFLGSSSTLFHTLENGSYSLVKFQRLLNNGNAPNLSSSRILQLRCPWLVALFGWLLNSSCIDLVVPSFG